jgi:5-methylcytosine-specific restriction endonuclease McrA
MRKYRTTHALTPEQKAQHAAYNKTYRETHRAEKASYFKTHHAAHKAERTAYNKAYRKAHPAKMAARDRMWNNRRRAESRGCEIAPDVSAATYARIMAGDPSCTYCPEPATDVDHIWPFDLYGAETDENLVPACKSCNSSKHAKPLTEWSWAKVEYGAARNTKVATELARLVALIKTHTINVTTTHDQRNDLST